MIVFGFVYEKDDDTCMLRRAETIYLQWNRKGGVWSYDNLSSLYVLAVYCDYPLVTEWEL